LIIEDVKLTTVFDRATTMDVNEVGAMDVSWSEAQRAETNVIARSDDRATTCGK
jgi:hypothetical protein